jgi:hypothetical protein
MPGVGEVLVDQVHYDDRSPWPLKADGYGRALSRASVEAFGDAASSWSALVPTPGTVAFAQIADVNFDGETNGDDIDGFVQIVANPSGYETAYGQSATMVADVDGDGDIDFDDIDDFVALLRGAVPATAAQVLGGLNADVLASSASSPVAPDRLAVAFAATGHRAEQLRDDSLVASGEDREERRRVFLRRPATDSVGAGAAVARRHERRGLSPRRRSGRRDVEHMDGSWETSADRVLETQSVWLGHIAVMSRRWTSPTLGR